MEGCHALSKAAAMSREMATSPLFGEVRLD